LDCAAIAFGEQYIRRNGSRVFSEDVYGFENVLTSFPPESNILLTVSYNVKRHVVSRLGTRKRQNWCVGG
jgi:hypothetical protein